MKVSQFKDIHLNQNKTHHSLLSCGMIFKSQMTLGYRHFSTLNLFDSHLLST